MFLSTPPHPHIYIHIHVQLLYIHKYILLVWPTCWTASCSTLNVCLCVCVCACVRACVCVCVSGQYHQYCSVHDEWLIMKLCMYVRYHTANNVSNFGGDSVTQLNLINLIVCVCVCVCVCVSGDMSPYCSAHDEWLIMKLCMYVRYRTANNVSNFGGDPITLYNNI